MSVANPGDGNYVYQARACNANGCSAWVASAAVHVAHVPPAPASISVPGTSTGVLGISWPAATYATSYSLEQSTDNANYDAVYNGAATSASIGVGATGVYYYRVKGRNANGCGPYGPVAASTVTILPSQAPSVKLFVFTVPGFVGYFSSLGLPLAAAYLTIALELLGGLALVFGVYARWVAVPLFLELLGTIAVVHSKLGWEFNNKGGGWEYPAFWATALVVFILLGDGPYTLRPSRRIG